MSIKSAIRTALLAPFAATLAVQGLAAQDLPVVPDAVGSEVENTEPEPVPAPVLSPAESAAGIVVRGIQERRSSWKRSESDHAILYGNGSESQLRKASEGLEQVHFLMSRIFPKPDNTDTVFRPRLILIGRSDFMDALGLENARTAEGPYPSPFDQQRYYDPRETGAILAVGRSDQIIGLTTATNSALEDDPLSDSDGFEDAFSSDEDSGGFPGLGGFGLARPGGTAPVRRDWENLLNSAYAQQFLLAHHPAAYPRWFLDGVGALFSTVGPGKDGTLNYGKYPPNYLGVTYAFGDLNVADVLTGRTLAEQSRESAWTPYHAWLLTHYFFLGSHSQPRRQQLGRYLAAVQAGKPMAVAALAFGDMAALQAEVDKYGKGKTFYRRVTLPDNAVLPPLIDNLTVGEASVLEARLAMGSRLSASATIGMDADISAAKADRLRAKALRRKVDWLADLRKTASDNPANIEARLLLAEAECRSGFFAQCLDVARAVASSEPTNAQALAWQGIALTGQASAMPAEAQPAAIAAARRPIVAANRIDLDAPLPLIAYFRSFSLLGLPVPQVALQGMLKAIDIVPDSPELRLELGRELVRVGRTEEARDVLIPVAYGGYDTPERAEAVRLVAAIPAAPAP